jgi:putative transposase
MPRRPRIHIPGVPQHVIQRGVNRQPIFFAADDYVFYLDWLGVYAAQREVALHAYCLMTNHLHLLLTVPSQAALSGLMQDIGRRYVQYVNYRYQRCGGLWQGRYKSSHVQSERYLLVCMRYVEMNPVRARMVAAPGEYPWSSYAANALGQPNEILTPHPEYLSLDVNASARWQAYRALFASAVDDPAHNLIRPATQQGVVAGDRKFIEEIESSQGLQLQLRRQGRPEKGSDPFSASID